MIQLVRCGALPYGQALAWQLQLREALYARREADEADGPVGYVLSLQHRPTVTLGKRGELDALLDPARLAARGVEVYKIDRGGEATFHEPGQLVVYPILDLRALELGVVDLIRNMARCLAEELAELGVQASYDPEHPGLWTDETPRRKLASVGMRVSGGVSTHGVALNVVNAMEGFGWIVPCGMPQAPMARLLDVLDPRRSPAPEALLEHVERGFLARLADYLGQPLRPAAALEPPPAPEWIAPLDPMATSAQG